MFAAAAGPIIISLNEQAVASSSDLKNKVGLLNIGDTVKLKILRQGKENYFSVKIGDRTLIRNSSGDVSTSISLLNGLRFSETERGVVISKTDIHSKAAYSGLKEGDIIVSVNQKQIKTIKELLKYAKQKKNSILFNIHRGNLSIFIAINE